MKPVYIVAELSANHNHLFNRAVNLIQAAKYAGANAVKIQTYTPDTMTIDCNNEHFIIGKGTVWEGKKLYDLYSDAYTPWEWHKPLQEIATSLGLDFFSTPFDVTAVDFLEELSVPFYKVASFEITDIPLLQRIAHTGKPVFVSTGMATFSEITEAVYAIEDAGNRNITLLKCTSAYPARCEEMNLITIQDMKTAFRYPVGLSDHSLSTTIPVAAVALGASIIEKHLTLSRYQGGPDSTFSMEPDEFAQMVAAVRETEKALGTVSYKPSDREEPSLKFRRSLFVVKDIQKGELLTDDNVRSIRPGVGISPKYLPAVLGARARKDITRGTPLMFNLVY